MKKLVTILATVATIAALGACSPTESTKKEPAPVETVAQPDEPIETPEPEAEVADVEEDAGPEIATWGEAFEYENGLVVTLGQPTGYAPSDTAAGNEGFTSFIILDVSITNGSTDVYSPTLFTLQGTSGGTAISEVFDSANGVGGSQYGAGDLLPGQTFTFKAAFGVANTADLTFDVSPGFEYDSSYFQGAAA